MFLILAVFQDVIEPKLGTGGVLLSLALNAAFAYIAYRANVRAKTAEAWQSTATAAQSAEAAAKSEMQTHKDRATRLESEKLKLAEEVGRLQAATDLSVLQKQNQEEHQQIVSTLTALQSSLTALQKTVIDQTTALLGFQTHNAQAFDAIIQRLEGREAN